MSAVLEEYQRLTQKRSPRPTTWADVIGNTIAVEELRESIRAADIQGRPVPHTLLFGNSGQGKSTLARILAADVGGGFIETTASTLETPTDMIRILFQLNDERERTGKPSTLFIDELHQLGNAKGRQSIDPESIYPLLEDWFWPHNLFGKVFTGLDGVEYTVIAPTVPVWPFTCIGATTEPGMLSQPVLRRFLCHVELRPYSEEDISRILEGAARRMEWPITPEAAAELAKYARRNPGRAQQLLTNAQNRAVATGREITLDVATEIIGRMRLYPLGLGETDIAVLKLLQSRPKGVGQAEICRAVGISVSQFSAMLEPYLRLLGFCETLSRRMLTVEGLKYLASIDGIDTTRPDIKAKLA